MEETRKNAITCSTLNMIIRIRMRKRIREIKFSKLGYRHELGDSFATYKHSKYGYDLLYLLESLGELLGKCFGERLHFPQWSPRLSRRYVALTELLDLESSLCDFDLGICALINYSWAFSCFKSSPPVNNGPRLRVLILALCRLFNSGKNGVKESFIFYWKVTTRLKPHSFLPFPFSRRLSTSIRGVTSRSMKPDPFRTVIQISVSSYVVEFKKLFTMTLRFVIFGKMFIRVNMCWNKRAVQIGINSQARCLSQ